MPGSLNVDDYRRCWYAERFGEGQYLRSGTLLRDAYHDAVGALLDVE
ncbi:MAG: hypothetical protein M3041_19700 [Acidobacteriota bacterium]|nr:hypothetical protein [Acidobacteriota bacterium]